MENVLLTVELLFNFRPCCDAAQPADRGGIGVIYICFKLKNPNEMGHLESCHPPFTLMIILL